MQLGMQPPLISVLFILLYLNLSLQYYDKPSTSHDWGVWYFIFLISLLIGENTASDNVCLYRLVFTHQRDDEVSVDVAGEWQYVLPAVPPPTT